MYIFTSQLLNSGMKFTIVEKLDKQTEGNRGMKCVDCKSKMKLDKESSYMKQYKCGVCGRIETLWIVCVTA